MTRLAAFSKFLGYAAGGAEKSTHALLEARDRAGDGIVVCGVEGAMLAGRRLPDAAMPAHWRTVRIGGLVQLPRFGYTEYVANRSRLARWFATLEADELWTYGLLAPAAAAGFAGPVTFFVRSESDLGVVSNYYEGVRRPIKTAYTAVESPAIACWRADLRRMAAGSRVVANSRFMAGRVRETFGVEATIELPRVDVASLRAGLAGEAASAPVAPRWVVFVGDSVWKGLPLVREMARRMPGTAFRIFSRFVPASHTEDNIHWEPWTTDEWRIYSGARLVIVPSQCEEAYGRVAREAFLLGIPVLASRVGGLPEAVDDDPQSLVAEYTRADAWIDAIRHALREHEGAHA